MGQVFSAIGALVGALVVLSVLGFIWGYSSQAGAQFGGYTAIRAINGPAVVEQH